MDPTQDKGAPPALAPTAPSARSDAIDAARGIGLFGVLAGNLLSGFRVPLVLAATQHHTHAGVVNYAVDEIVEWFIAAKAATMFATLFGIGLAIQCERASRAERSRWQVVGRRLAVLLAIGIFHMFVIWNGDILALYAVAGMIALSLAVASSRALWILVGVIAIAASLPYRGHAPVADAAGDEIAAALRTYGSGSVGEIMAFRAHEAIAELAPLAWVFLPRTVGLFVFGMLVFRSGVALHPEDHARLLRVVAAVGLALGVAAAAVLYFDRTNLVRVGRWRNPLLAASTVPMALGYLSTFLLLFRRDGRFRRAARVLAPLGRMALTNYLMQSVVFGFVFYSYGFALYGKVGPAAALAGGAAFYVGQVVLSAWWLKRYRFGPVEWFWRWATYGVSGLRLPPGARWTRAPGSSFTGDR